MSGDLKERIERTRSRSRATAFRFAHLRCCHRREFADEAAFTAERARLLAELVACADALRAARAGR